MINDFAKLYIILIMNEKLVQNDLSFFYNPNLILGQAAKLINKMVDFGFQIFGVGGRINDFHLKNSIYQRDNFVLIRNGSIWQWNR